MIADKVRVGVVGTSWWADGRLLPNVSSHPQAAVVAICGRQRERAQMLAQKYAIPQVFTDYHELIARGGLDALIVGVPDDLHYPITLAALEAGLHVVCEKPLALNVQQARAMYEKAVARGVKHMVFFTNRWLPAQRYVHQLIADGYVGKPFQLQLRYASGYLRRRDYAWRLDRTRANGVLGDLGSHLIDVARWYIGEIAQVSAHLASYLPREVQTPANDSASLLLEFANGAQGMIYTTLVAHAEQLAQQQFVILGDAGTLEIDILPADQLAVRGMRGGADRFEALPIPDSYWQGVQNRTMDEVFTRQAAGCRAFIDAILMDTPLTPNFYDGLQAQAVMDAALQSHEERRWVEVGRLAG